MSCKTCGNQQCCCNEKVVTKYGKTGGRGPRGKRGAPGPSGPSNLTIANTVFVMKNGSDVTGLVERLDKPFLTIAAARAAANTAFTSRTNDNRIKIVVESGFYNENIILDKFIDYDLGNSVIDGEITDDQVDFGASNDGVWTNIIYGPARIHNTDSSGKTHAMQIWKPNTKLLIYAAELSSKEDNALAITNGIVRVVGPVKIFTLSINKNFAIPVEMTQGGLEEDWTFSILEVFDGDIFVLPDAISPPVAFQFGGGDKNQVLSLINCRVSNPSDMGSGGNNAAIAIGNQVSSNAVINLYNTVLYSLGGASVYTHISQAADIKYYHSNMANSAAGGSGSLTVLLGSLVVDSAVAPEFSF